MQEQRNWNIEHSHTVHLEQYENRADRVRSYPTEGREHRNGKQGHETNATHISTYNLVLALIKPLWLWIGFAPTCFAYPRSPMALSTSSASFLKVSFLVSSTLPDILWATP